MNVWFQHKSLDHILRQSIILLHAWRAQNAWRYGAAMGHSRSSASSLLAHRIAGDFKFNYMNYDNASVKADAGNGCQVRPGLGNLWRQANVWPIRTQLFHMHAILIHAKGIPGVITLIDYWSSYQPIKLTLEMLGQT